MYTHKALRVVAARVSSWLSQSPALRHAKRTSSRAFWLAPDSQGPLKEAHLDTCAAEVVEEWFANGVWRRSAHGCAHAAADCPPLDHATEVFKLPIGHPAGKKAGLETSLGLRSTKDLTRGHLVLHYNGILQTEQEWLEGEDREDNLSFHYDVDMSSQTDGHLSALGRTPLILEAAPAWSDRPTGSPAPIYGGLINCQFGMAPESVNTIHFTVIGTACCSLCPTFPHPHIFHMTKRDIQAGEELILEYGGTHSESAEEDSVEMPNRLRVKAKDLKGEMCLSTFDILLGSGEVLRPIAFEERAGRGKNKNWRRSIWVTSGPDPAPCTIQKFFEAYPALDEAALRLVRPGRWKRPRPDHLAGSPGGRLGALLQAAEQGSDSEAEAEAEGGAVSTGAAAAPQTTTEAPPEAAADEDWLATARAAASRRVAALARYEVLAAQLAAVSSEMESLRAEIQRGV